MATVLFGLCVSFVVIDIVFDLISIIKYFLVSTFRAVLAVKPLQMIALCLYFCFSILVWVVYFYDVQ